MITAIEAEIRCKRMIYEEGWTTEILRDLTVNKELREGPTVYNKYEATGSNIKMHLNTGTNLRIEVGSYKRLTYLLDWFAQIHQNIKLRQ